MWTTIVFILENPKFLVGLSTIAFTYIVVSSTVLSNNGNKP